MILLDLKLNDHCLLLRSHTLNIEKNSNLTKSVDSDNFIPDVTVIGAGIIGTSIAERLQSEGKQVMLIDREGIGLGCSKGNAGHFATDIILPLANFSTLLRAPKYLLDPLGPLTIDWSYLPKLLPWLTRFTWAAMPHKTKLTIEALKQLNRPSIHRYKELLKRTKLEHLMTQKGALTVYSTSAAEKANLKHAKLVTQHEVAVQILSAGQVSELEPGLNKGIRGALYYPNTAHSINPHKLVEGLADSFRQFGGVFKKADVTGINNTDSNQVEILTDGKKLISKEVVIACGAWSKSLAESIGHKTPLETERGYHYTLPTPKVEINRPITSYERSFVMTPMEEGLRLAGTVELAGLNKPENFERAKQLFRHAQELLPNICGDNATSWMGHRPSFPDSLPAICRSTINSKVMFAFGHQHLGLTQAAVTADLISDLQNNKMDKRLETQLNINRF